MYYSTYALPDLYEQNITIPNLWPMPQVKPVEKPLEERIIEYVAKRKNVTLKELKSHNREAHLAYARQLCMVVIRNKTQLSFNRIAKLFGRHHTTVISAERTIQNWMDTNEEKRWEIQKFLSRDY